MRGAIRRGDTPRRSVAAERWKTGGRSVMAVVVVSGGGQLMFGDLVVLTGLGLLFGIITYPSTTPNTSQSLSESQITRGMSPLRHRTRVRFGGHGFCITMDRDSTQRSYILKLGILDTLSRKKLYLDFCFLKRLSSTPPPPPPPPRARSWSAQYLSVHTHVKSTAPKPTPRPAPLIFPAARGGTGAPMQQHTTGGHSRSKSRWPVCEIRLPPLGFISTTPIFSRAWRTLRSTEPEALTW